MAGENTQENIRKGEISEMEKKETLNKAVPQDSLNHFHY